MAAIIKIKISCEVTSHLTPDSNGLENLMVCCGFLKGKIVKCKLGDVASLHKDRKSVV